MAARRKNVGADTSEKDIVELAILRMTRKLDKRGVLGRKFKRLKSLEEINHALDQLDERKRDIVKKRLGLVGDRPLTLDEIGAEYQRTKERVRQIQSQAIAELKVILK